MFDDLLEKIKQIMASRLIPIAIVLIALFGVLVSRLFKIQIVDGQKNSDVAALQETRTTYTDAPRGLIRASNGEILADNELVYTVELYDVLSTNAEKNDMIAYLIETLEEYDNEIDISIPLTYDGEFEFTVSGGPLTTFKTNAFAQGKLSEEHAKASAEEVFNYMRDERFYVDEKYSTEEALEIIAFRYAMYVMWPPQNPLVVCKDVDDETVVAIKEREPKLTGVNIGKSTDRFYIEGNEPFAHVLGYTGLINESELADFQDKGIEKYDSTDNIGKAGLEKGFEDILSGEKGITTVSVDGLGRPIEMISNEDAIAGSDLYLTIDSDLQRSVYDLTEQKLASILLSKINNSKSAGSKGTSASDILIPIYDVYFALIENEIINISHFNADDATDLEKEVYEIFLTRLESVLSQLDTVLAPTSGKTASNLSKEMNEYMTYIYDLIQTYDIIDKEKVDKSDEVYIQFSQDKISLSEYLQHVIASNWINLEKLNVDNDYYDTKELFEKLLDYLKEILYKDKEFHKRIYYHLIDSYKLSGTKICLLLFDQGVLEYNEKEVARLRRGGISAYGFITEKIRTLEITPGQLGLEPFSASVVVTDVNTGKVLAFVSYPSYDSNNYADYLTTKTSPLYPRAIREAIAPGSTFKMVTAITGLEEGLITPYTKIRDQYIFTKVRPHVRCHVNNHGSVNVIEALEVSCNYFFYETAYRLATRSGKFDEDTALEVLGNYAKDFGLGQEGRTKLENELATTAYTDVSKDSVIQSAIGQGSNIFTPAELSTYVTTIANSGKRFDLTLIDKTDNGEKLTDNEATYTQLDEISDSSWKYVQQGMYEVCNGSRVSGSRRYEELRNAGYNIAGKTGTAQISKNNANHALFVSYGPYENPEISVTVVIPNGYTSGNAAELARDIYKYYFNVGEEVVSGEANEADAELPIITD